MSTIELLSVKLITPERRRLGQLKLDHDDVGTEAAQAAV